MIVVKIKILILLVIGFLSYTVVKSQDLRELNSPCHCPFTKMKASAKKIKEGGTVKFTVKITKKQSRNCKLVYDWSVSNGVIIRGQGTKSIIVKATRGTGGGQITAAALINPDNGCEGNPSETIEVLKP